MNSQNQLSSLAKFLSKNIGSDFENTLDDLLTPEEIKNIYERIMILDYLKSWLTQRDVAKKLWVSISTVSRWSRILQYGKKGGNFKF